MPYLHDVVFIRRFASFFGPLSSLLRPGMGFSRPVLHRLPTQRRRSAMSLIGLSGLVFSLSAIAWPQTQQGAAVPAEQSNEYTMRAYSRLTVVDVLAYDGKDNPIRGLPESAFTIYEDGKPQTITNFRENSGLIASVASALPALPPHIYTNLQPTPQNNVVNVLLLDSLNTGTADQIFLKDEAVRFIRSMPPGTRIAIVGLSSRLHLLQGFTSDPAILEAAVRTKKNRSLPSPFDDAAGDVIGDQIDAAADATDDAAVNLQEFQNEQMLFQTDMRNRMTIEALNQISAYLAGVKGRKNLIWFTSGMPLQMFPQGGVDDLATMSDYSKDLRHTTDLLTNAQIAVFPIDVGGVMTNPAASVVKPVTGFANGRGDSMSKAIAAFDMKTGRAHLGMEAIADATGGIAYYNTNDLKDAVAKAISNGSNYYTLAYIPPNPNLDGSFHRITVKVNVPSIHLSYRKGYYADDIERNRITPGITLATTAPEPYGSNMQASMARGVPTSSQLLFMVRIEPHGDTMNAPGEKTIGTLDSKLRGRPLRRYEFQYSLPGRQIIFNEGENNTYQGSLEFDIAAYDVYGKLVTGISQGMNLTLTSERYQMLQKKPFQLLQYLDLPPGELFVRVGILDANSDKTGTIEVPLEVTSKPALNMPSSNKVSQH